MKRTGWWLAGGLVVLSLVPVVAGAARIHELATGAVITAENARFFAAPLPVVLHIVAASLFAVLGAFQFVPHLRSRKSAWHRRAGMLAFPAGVVVAVSGLWMTLRYPWPAGDGEAVYAMRLVVGAAMLVFLGLATVAIRRRDFAEHGAWMTRAYALAMGAGTHVFTHLPLLLLGTKPDVLGRAVAMGAGWAINLAIAEWSLRKNRGRGGQHGVVRPALQVREQHPHPGV